MRRCDIANVGLYYDKNFGDAVIVDSTSYLIRQILGDDFTSVTIVDLRGRSKFEDNTSERIKPRFHPRVSVNKSCAPIYPILFTTSTKFERENKTLCLRGFSGKDLIVFAGGSLIKYKYQDIYFYLSEAIRIATRMEIPVILHGVGVEGYCNKDRRCQLLKRAITQTVVKSITTRDDYATLNEMYLADVPWIHRAPTGDAAIWASEAYGVMASRSSTKVGIGIIRHDIFAQYGYYIDERKLISTYVNLVHQLRRMGLDCVLFTNGSSEDYQAMLKVQMMIGDISAIQPLSPRQLVETIAGFAGVISGRLHANIIAYALNVPSIGLVWNDKLQIFGTKIGHPERFVCPDRFRPEFLANRLIHAIEEGINQEQKERLKILSWSTLQEQFRIVGLL